MPEIKQLTPEEKKEMKINKSYAIKYKCECGATLIYESDMKPRKLKKCFKCNQKLLDNF